MGCKMHGILTIKDAQENKTEQIVIGDKPFLLGRSPACDFVLESPDISRRHCIIEMRDNHYWISDLASANGTLINQEPVKESPLNKGDIIVLGAHPRWILSWDIEDKEEKTDTTFHHRFSDTTNYETRFQKPITHKPDFLNKSTTELTQSIITLPESSEQAFLHVLYKISRILMSSLEEERLLDLMMDELMAVIPADRGCVVLIQDPQSTEGFQYKTLSLKQKETTSPQISPELIISRTVVHKAIKEQTSIMIANLKDFDDMSTSETVVKKGIQSTLCVPIKGKNQIYGVLYLDTIIKNHSFKENDLDLVTAVANQTGIAMDNAVLWRKMKNYNDELENEVTARTREIAFEQNRLKSILNCMGEGVIVTDVQDHFTLLNPAAKNLFQLTEEDHQSLITTYPPEIQDMAEDLKNPSQAMKDPGSIFSECKIQLGKQHIRVNIAPIRDDENNYLGSVLVNQDITHDVEIEQLKADFISMLSHDLKNPLTVILTSSQMLLKGYLGQLSDKMSGQIQSIFRNARTMLEIVNNFLDVSKLDSGKVTIASIEVDIVKLLNSIISNFQTQANELGIELCQSLPQNPTPILMGDPLQLERVFNNLINNSLKFTQSPGKVSLSCEYNENKYVIKVADTGLGISEEDIPHLFDRFYRTSQSQGKIKGTGLGLYIVKSLVELHSGSIAVNSQLGVGTTFTITLPIHQGSNENI